MAIFLSEADVGRLATIDLALESVEAAFKALFSGQASSRPRDRTRVRGGSMHVMQSGWAERGYLGLKAYTSFGGGARSFHYFLYSAETGQLLAILEADRLGQVRTGAASGVATRYMARPEASRIGILGTGWQADSQLLAVARVRAPGVIRAYSRSAANREAFAKRMAEMGLEVEAAGEPRQAVEGMDVVLTITTSREPVLVGEWLQPGMHVNAAGSNALIRREVDDEVLKRVDRIVVDHLETAQREAGDLLPGIEKAYFTWEAIHELREVVGGGYPGRASADEITLFKSHGLAIEDLALAAAVFERAVAENVGQPLPL